MKGKKIAVTGSLSSGKSTVCQFFKELGAYTISADAIVHQLLTPESPVSQQVLALFGPDILTQNRIDRAKIAKKAFYDPKLLQALEHLIHPLVHDEIEKEYEKRQSSFPLFIAEIPLLFEIGADSDFPIILTVCAPEALCQKRFENSSGHTWQEYEQRMKRQWKPEEKNAKATYTIVNDGSKEKLKAVVTKLYAQLLEHN